MPVLADSIPTAPPVPTCTRPTREDGVAGQYAYRTVVAYPGEPSRTIRFYANVYGGPIVMVANGGPQYAISAQVRDRLGDTLTAEWVVAFFAPHAPWN
jgi:hypothetical protein